MPVLFSHDQFSSGAQSCPALCDPKDCRMPGLPVHQQLPELAQTHVHLAGDAIQPSHYISSKENVHLSKSCSRFKAPSDAAFGLEPFPNPQARAPALFLAFPGGLCLTVVHTYACGPHLFPVPSAEVSLCWPSRSKGIREPVQSIALKILRTNLWKESR